MTRAQNDDIYVVPVCLQCVNESILETLVDEEWILLIFEAKTAVLVAQLVFFKHTVAHDD